MSDGQLSERERVYRELDRTRRKCGVLREEVRTLKSATTAKEAAVMRREAQQYRKALSNIAHRLDNGGVDDETLRHIVDTALFLRGLKASQRDEVQQFHASETP